MLYKIFLFVVICISATVLSVEAENNVEGNNIIANWTQGYAVGELDELDAFLNEEKEISAQNNRAEQNGTAVKAEREKRAEPASLQKPPVSQDLGTVLPKEDLGTKESKVSFSDEMGKESEPTKSTDKTSKEAQKEQEGREGEGRRDKEEQDEKKEKDTYPLKTEEYQQTQPEAKEKIEPRQEALGGKEAKEKEDNDEIKSNQLPTQAREEGENSLNNEILKIKELLQTIVSLEQEKKSLTELFDPNIKIGSYTLKINPIFHKIFNIYGLFFFVLVIIFFLIVFLLYYTKKKALNQKNELNKFNSGLEKFGESIDKLKSKIQEIDKNIVVLNSESEKFNENIAYLNSKTDQFNENNVTIKLNSQETNKNISALNLKLKDLNENILKKFESRLQTPLSSSKDSLEPPKNVATDAKALPNQETEQKTEQNAPTIPTEPRESEKQPSAPKIKKSELEEQHGIVQSIADKVAFMEVTMSKMDRSVRGYKQLFKSLNQIKDNLKVYGYEYVEMMGKPYHPGMKVIANFIEDETLPEGQQIITGITKPQINYHGVMVQSAKITVSQNLRED